MGRDVGAQRGDAAADSGATFAFRNGVRFSKMLRLVGCSRRLQTGLHKLVRHQRPFQGRVCHGFFRLGEQAVPDRDRSPDFLNRLLRADFSRSRFRGGLPVLRRIAFRQHIGASIASAI
jgi:hypothetical protein